ncbi:DUF1033 family protein [Streptococcus macacae]|uniref:PF06279 family protein n=1 Tax=Streptococcus macacae NCTC 11558 TaxID=764298 RepID=G5JWA6_9STRE|nr:DUF1033 family protein [Streptococcus macacae]EHJ52712.1 hypothetical protein STRMA_1852 [Streptococcus macacae NCTC 11558]SUN77761.1 DNA binding protein [Streptococcus macacae NCTC 11558]
MYQVIRMYGDLEPWWFLDDWKDDIVKVSSFENYYEALRYYKKEWLSLYKCYPQYDSRSRIMTAFWNQKDQRWCEECGDFLQQYDSIALLKNWRNIPKKWYRPGYSRRYDKTCTHPKRHKIRRKLQD